MFEMIWCNTAVVPVLLGPVRPGMTPVFTFKIAYKTQMLGLNSKFTFDHMLRFTETIPDDSLEFHTNLRLRRALNLVFGSSKFFQKSAL